MGNIVDFFDRHYGATVFSTAVILAVLLITYDEKGKVDRFSFLVDLNKPELTYLISKDVMMAIILRFGTTRLAR